MPTWCCGSLWERFFPACNGRGDTPQCVPSVSPWGGFSDRGIFSCARPLLPCPAWVTGLLLSRSFRLPPSAGPSPSAELACPAPLSNGPAPPRGSLALLPCQMGLPLRGVPLPLLSAKLPVPSGFPPRKTTSGADFPKSPRLFSFPAQGVSISSATKERAAPRRPDSERESRSHR